MSISKYQITNSDFKQPLKYEKCEVYYVTKKCIYIYEVYIHILHTYNRSADIISHLKKS
jgi:hypothetical protein